MCEYSKYNEKGQLICDPKGDLCLYCVCGNSNRYKEIEKEKIEKYRRNGEKI